MKLTQFQLKELSKYWLDLSKITLVSLVVKFFEPEAPRFTIESSAAIFVGLTVGFVFVIIGLRLSRDIKQ